MEKTGNRTVAEGLQNDGASTAPEKEIEVVAADILQGSTAAKTKPAHLKLSNTKSENHGTQS
ncbi:hypothetical protein GR160_10630 [Flavobacterium sp. Sd200]|uniref:hypothetical protein n=1 Tax=Flavobacterium sp. Sd200 TaxID=2692211 RepID=UPI0013707A5D|nr:hypothetical protein [Flavobacterium sp. Sd200]MXN91681.1 hypothetical protein [Flavobacterium sp. Sd200]